MQPPVVAAARARIVKRGYMDVHIYKTKEGYMVEAICPLSLMGVAREMSIEELFHLFR